MSKYIADILCLLILLSMTSCMPGGITEVSPQLKGKVLNARTGKAISGAVIRYVKIKYDAESISDNVGNYLLGPLKQWHYLTYIGSPGYMPFPDKFREEYFNIHAQITCVASGYEGRRYTLVSAEDGYILYEQNSTVPIMHCNYRQDIRLNIFLQPAGLNTSSKSGTNLH